MVQRQCVKGGKSEGQLFSFYRQLFSFSFEEESAWFILDLFLRVILIWHRLWTLLMTDSRQFFFLEREKKENKKQTQSLEVRWLMVFGTIFMQYARKTFQSIFHLGKNNARITKHLNTTHCLSLFLKQINVFLKKYFGACLKTSRPLVPFWSCISETTQEQEIGGKFYFCDYQIIR